MRKQELEREIYVAPSCCVYEVEQEHFLETSVHGTHTGEQNKEEEWGEDEENEGDGLDINL
ncbi:hypothetical protein [Hoylesella marshii]|nr:hypothetical protein [Hoylesella marshii]